MFGFGLKSKAKRVIREEFFYEVSYMYEPTFNAIYQQGKMLGQNEYSIAIFYMNVMMNVLIENKKEFGGDLNEVEHFISKHTSNINRILHQANSPESEIRDMLDQINKEFDKVRNSGESTSQEVIPKKAETEKILKNFRYDYMIVYSSMITDIIANEYSEHLDIKEIYILGAIHYLYWIDCVGEGYGYDMSTKFLYGNNATGLLVNNLGVYSESAGLGPSFIMKVGETITKICHSSEKADWLEEVKKRTEQTAQPLYSLDEFKKFNFKFVEDYAESLRVPGWNETNAFFLMLMDAELLQSAKQDLSDIVKEAEDNSQEANSKREESNLVMALKFVIVKEAEDNSQEANSKREQSNLAMTKEIIKEANEEITNKREIKKVDIKEIGFMSMQAGEDVNKDLSFLNGANYECGNGSSNVFNDKTTNIIFGLGVDKLKNYSPPSHATFQKEELLGKELYVIKCSKDQTSIYLVEVLENQIITIGISRTGNS